jgi:glycosyltransferase involved in cell wall biosynthesis
MKILLLTSTFPEEETDHLNVPFLPPLIEDLVVRGDTVTVLTHRKERDAWSPKGATVVRFDAGPAPCRLAEVRLHRPQEFLFLARAMLAGERAARRLLAGAERPDVMLAFWLVPAGLWAARAGARHSVPFAVWALGSDVRRVRRLPGGAAILRHVARRAAHVYADGFALKEELDSIGVASEFLSSARQLPLAATAVATRWEIGFAGRLAEVKGADLLAEAMDRVFARRPFRAAIAGAGELEGRLRATRVFRAGALEFLGVLGPGAMVDFYAACGAVVIPSRAESVPLVLGEAVAAGRPVIASAVGDMAELVPRLDLGLTIPPGNVEALASAIELHLETPLRLSPAGAAKLLDRLDPVAARRRLIADLEALATRSRLSAKS